MLYKTTNKHVIASGSTEIEVTRNNPVVTKYRPGKVRATEHRLRHPTRMLAQFLAKTLIIRGRC